MAEFEPPSWDAFAEGARPPFHDVADREPEVVRHGWQHEAVVRVERKLGAQLMHRVADSEQAQLPLDFSAPPIRR